MKKRNNERHSKIFILDILKTCTIQLGSHLSVKILSHTEKSHACLCPHTTGLKSTGMQENKKRNRQKLLDGLLLKALNSLEVHLNSALDEP